MPVTIVAADKVAAVLFAAQHLNTRTYTADVSEHDAHSLSCLNVIAAPRGSDVTQTPWNAIVCNFADPRKMQ